MPGAVPILTWHALDDGGSVIATPVARFRAQIRALGERRFQAITLRELLDAWEAGTPLPPRPVVLTFDDGFRSVLEVAAPILEQAGYRATVFAVAGYCGRRNAWPGQGPGIPALPLLSPAELRSLVALGFEVGAHGVRHARLDRLSVTEAEREIAESGRFLADALGREVTVFAYPYGRTTPVVRRLAAAYYRAACTDELRVASSGHDRHALGRLDMYYYRDPRRFRWFATAWGDRYLGLRRLGRRLRALGT